MLFLPDIFSAPRPSFSPVNESIASLISSVIGNGYSETVGPVTQIAQLGALEINSNNFKIQTPRATFLLKKIPLQSPGENFKSKHQLLDWLVESKTAVPSLVRTDGGDPALVFSGFQWFVFNFLDGDYYVGEVETLKELGENIGHLHSVLLEVPNHLKPSEAIAYFSNDENILFKVSEQQKNNWADIYGENVAVALSDHWNKLALLREYLIRNRSRIQKEPVQMCHMDLHPHNLLIKNGKFQSFVDCDSIKSIPLPAAIGYGLYKLTKQFASHNKLNEANPYEIANGLNLLREGFQKMYATSDLSVEKLKLFALAELVRRIFIIFRLNIVHKNSAWNHVLPMHLAGIQEIELIFGPV